MNIYNQMAEMTLQAGGVTASTSGEVQHWGFAVSIFPELEEHLKLPMGQGYLGTRIHSYMHKHRRLLEHPRTFFGAWVNGDIVFDIVVVCHSANAAEALAREFHQVSFYNIAGKEEIRITVKEDELLHRLNNVPIPKAIDAVHYSKEAIAGGVIEANRRGQNGHEEAARLNLNGALPGVNLYYAGAEPEQQTKHRPWISTVKGNWAIADLTDPAVMSLIIDKVVSGAISAEEYRNRAETVIYNAGYDGYTDGSGRLVVFSDVCIETCERR